MHLGSDSGGTRAKRWPIRVYYEDTDAAGVVYHTAYLRFAERGRSEWLRCLGYNHQRIRDEMGCVFAVRGLCVEYRRPAVLDDELAVLTTAERHGRMRLIFHQHIVRGPSDVRLASVRVEVVSFDAFTHKPRPIPSDLAVEPTDVR